MLLRSRGEEAKRPLIEESSFLNFKGFMKLNTQLYERATLQEIEPMNYEPQASFHLSS